MTDAIAGEGEKSSPYIGDPNSALIMERMDERLSPDCRALVHEFGWDIVAKSLDEADHVDVAALRRELETWRDRRQAQWLRTDYVSGRLRRSFNVVALSAEMEKVRRARALKVASRAKLRAMMLEEAERVAG
jgi:hypothetical protein